MSVVLQMGANGLILGAIYVILALGWVMVYRVSGLVLLVSGEFVVVGGLTVAELSVRGWSLPVAVVCAIAACCTIAALLELLLRQLPGIGDLESVLLMIGLSFLIQQLAHYVFGPQPRVLEPFLPATPVNVLGVSVLPHQVLLLAVAALIAGGVGVFMSKTLTGRALRACAENATGARLTGIDPLRMRLFSLMTAGALGGLAGVLLVPIQPIDPHSGLALSLTGFVAAVFGGWTFTRAPIAGLTLGILSSFTSRYISSAYEEVVIFVLLIVLLVLATTRIMPPGLRARLSD